MARISPKCTKIGTMAAGTRKTMASNLNPGNTNPGKANHGSSATAEKSTIPKEKHSTLTDENGNLQTIWGNNPIFVEKEETSLGVYEDWTTDGHELIVYADGYEAHKETLTFTEPITKTIILEESSTVIPTQVILNVSSEDINLGISCLNENLTIDSENNNIDINTENNDLDINSSNNNLEVN